MIVSFTTVFAAGAGIVAAALIAALAALVCARVALGRARQARAGAELSALRVGELETRLAELASQVQELAVDLERTAALPTRPSLREAVALSRHGASTEELVSTCRIGLGEARLIQMLHGAARLPDGVARSEVH
jgi:hypothetical protein